MSTAEERDRRRKRIGRIGEKDAAAELLLRGYHLRCANYRCAGGEADLVADHGTDLVFVEVKARSTFFAGRPREAVTWTKRRRLVTAAEAYCAEHAIDDRPIRFDIVEVMVDRGRVLGIEVVQSAFGADE